MRVVIAVRKVHYELVQSYKLSIRAVTEALIGGAYSYIRIQPGEFFLEINCRDN